MIKDIERSFNILMKWGWVSVRGIKTYHALVAYAEERGYEVSEGNLLNGRITARLIVHE